MAENQMSELTKTRLRVFALATVDDMACNWLLGLLSETHQQAVDALNETCWGEDWHANPTRHRAQLRAHLPGK